MTTYARLLRVIILICGLQLSQPLMAGSSSLEEKFQDIFVTAGYSTAMGAAIGAALLSFQENPSSHLRYVAIGASVGFIGGSALGTFFAVSPSVRFTNDSQPQAIVAIPRHKERQVIRSPVIDAHSLQVSAVQTGLVLGRF